MNLTDGKEARRADAPKPYCWVVGLAILFVHTTHQSLQGNNLHTTSKDSSICLYPSNMGSKALRSWNINFICFIQGKTLCSWDLGQSHSTI